MYDDRESQNLNDGENGSKIKASLLEMIDKKSTLTLDNEELDVEQTGNIDENAPNDEFPDKFPNDPHVTPENINNGITLGGNENGNNKSIPENSVFRAGSLTEKFQDRSSLEGTSRNLKGLLAYTTNSNNNKLNTNGNSGLDRLTPTDALGLHGPGK